ncbi:MAG: translation initiation factor IF-3 [Deltaproteobacteria bacterium]|nr:translation initiation factor IF-3 [Deltaproteobacteria bacterium]MBW2072440.1 translation initiation factor IF-3 [Deltaproteobacteria bacterium]
MIKQVNVNDKIRASQVRLIGPDGTQLGIVPLAEALERAAQEKLDLVEVAPKATPPVCKIMDYGKYKYQQSKKSQEAKKKQATVQVKEVKIRPKTEEHDYQFKLRHIKRFLAEKNKAKVTIMFRGREIAFSELGLKMLERIIADTEDVAVVEQKPKLEGRNMNMLLAPRQ